MKKVLRNIMISVMTTLVVLGSFVGITALVGTCKTKYDGTTDQYENWMNYIEDETPLNEIALPGSHDAGTISMSWLANTQTFTLKEQLSVGVRYFDLRVNKEKNKYVFYHDIVNGVEFEPAFYTMVDFIKNHPSETLLLDFQHFKNDTQDYVKKVIDASLLNDGLLIQNNTEQSDLEFISRLKLKDVRGKCIVFWGDYNDKSLANDYKYLFARNDDECTIKGMSLDSKYVSKYHKSNSRDFVNKYIPTYITSIKGKIDEEGYKGLFVLQCQLTDGALIFGPYSREKSHDANMSKYIRNVANSDDLNIYNIFMRDFITLRKCKEIIVLNKNKSIIKDLYQEAFDEVFVNN